jgi:hypothetical protein
MVRSFAAISAPRTTDIPKPREVLMPTRLGDGVAATDPQCPAPALITRGLNGRLLPHKSWSQLAAFADAGTFDVDGLQGALQPPQPLPAVAVPVAASGDRNERPYARGQANSPVRRARGCLLSRVLARAWLSRIEPSGGSEGRSVTSLRAHTADLTRPWIQSVTVTRGGPTSGVRSGS